MAAQTTGARFLKRDGGVIAYEDTGGVGPLAIALPGMGDLRSEYRYLAPALAAAGYRVVTVDVRGFSETSAQWSDYSARAVGHDVLSLMDHLGADRAIVLGVSFAAGAALWAAHDAPTRVRRVVLIGPVVRDQKLSALTRLILDVGFAGPWRVRFWTTYWNSLFPAHKPEDQAEVRAALDRNLREPGRMSALRTMVSLSKAATEAILVSNTVRALIVMGTRDPDFPDAAAEAAWLAETLKGEQLTVEGAGHYLHTELPDEVAPGVIAFLNSLPLEPGA